MAKHTLTCDCGFKVEGDDHYQVEGTMWHHAIKEHSNQLASYSPEQIAGWILNADKAMGVSS